jgi:hypothetical protein
VQTPGGTQKTSIESLPADIQDYIARLRTEAEEANKLRKAEARAKKEAEDARLVEQGQFKELAAKHALRVQELEPVATAYTQLATLIASQIESQVKDWPAEVKTFDPGKDAPIEARLAWVEKSQPLVAALTKQTSGGNSPNPRPAGTPTKEEARDAMMNKLLKSGNYGAPRNM